MQDEKYDEERWTELQEALKAVPAEERDSGFNPFVDDDDPHALITQLKEDETDSFVNRLVNYLLALIPLIMIPYLYGALNMEGMVGGVTASLVVMVLTVVIALLFAFIGRKRRSDPLSAYWLGIALVENPYMLGNPILNLFAIVAMLVVLTWLGRLIYKNRHDNLFIAFATLPLVSWLVWTPGGNFIFQYVSPETMIEAFTLRSILSFVVTGIALGLLFLGRQRGMKWIGVFAMFFIAMFSQLIFVFWGFSSFTLPALLALAAMALITMGVPAFFFWRDRRRPREKQPAIS